MFSLTFRKNGEALFKHPIAKERISIGREPTCDIILPDENISRLHCEIKRTNGRLEITDASKNGITINGVSVKTARLSKGDTIGIGNWTAVLKEETGEQATAVERRDETKIIKFDRAKKEVTFGAVEVIFRTPAGEKVIRRLKRPKITIGSADSNDIAIGDDDYVSKKHLQLEMDGDNIILTDMGSTNGTFFEGKRVGRLAISKRVEVTAGKTLLAIRKFEEKEKIGPSEIEMGGLLGKSSAMREIVSLVSLVAPTDAVVCITGESGTGKELVARSVHDLSTRAKGPFVAINCGAVPPNIIESELFGHEKGAFTGAGELRRGVFEQSNGGTLFLDEIGEMPADLQTRLLRAIETKSIRRVGGQRDVPVDIRIIAATNQDLKQNVRSGRFREDLFFRLYIVPIHIPPLRERKEDIPILAGHFAGMFSPAGKDVEISPSALSALMKHNWPGNVRELKNTLQRAVIMSRGGVITSSEISLTDLKGGAVSCVMALTTQEKEAIVEALRRSKGNQSKAADILGIARTTLSNKIKKYDIDLTLFSI